MPNSLTYKSVLKSKRVTGLEAVFLPNEGLQFNAVILKKSKTGLEVETSHAGIIEAEELQKFIDSKLPINIVINGKGIIHRKLIVNEADSDTKLLERVFPNAKFSDFYFQKIVLSENTVFVSIARKNNIDELLASFIDKGYHFSGISLGPFCLNGIIPLIKLPVDGLTIANYKFEIVNNERIEDFQDNINDFFDKKISIAGEDIQHQSVLSFASAFDYFFPFQIGGLLSVPMVDKSKAELEQKKIYQLGGWTVLLVFLAILLGNFFLFDYYGKQFQQLNTAFVGKKGQLENLNEIKMKVNEKQAFLEKTGLKGISKTSFYSDRIALDFPETISLTHLDLFPLESKIKGNEPIVFLNKVIIVKGNCKKSTELNDWIRILKTKEWINDVSVLNYKQENVQEPGEFELKLTII